MNPILTALASGYSADKILGFLTSTFPKLAPRVQKAKGMGYTVDQILNLLSNQAEGDMESTYRTSGRVHAKKKREREESAKNALTTAARSAATYAVSKAAMQGIQKVAPGLAQGLGGAAQSPTPSPTPSPMQQTPGQQVGAGVQAPAPGPQVATAAQAMQQTPQDLFSQILGNVDVKQLPDETQHELGFIQMIAEKLQKEGKGLNDPAVVSLKKKTDNLIKKGPGLMAQEAQRFEKANTPGLQANDEDLFEQAKKLATESGNSHTTFLQRKLKIPNAQAEELSNRLKAEGSTARQVITPDGDIATIIDQPGKTAKVDVDGKKKVFDTDKLIESPLPEKDLADLYTDLISGIEKDTKQQVSRNVFWAGYDPETNELAYLPHDGRLYVYDNISPEDVEQLTGMLTQRKSTGSNYIGAWEQGTQSPIGAAMSALLKKLQKSRGEGKGYSSRFDVLYDAIEPAKIAKKKKQRDQERKKKAKKPGIN